jgi:hypothetical protein
MPRRRALFDPFSRTSEQRWLVVRNEHGSILESLELAPDIDLKRLFVASILEWIDDGWTVGEFSSVAAAFFCARAAERRMVAIERLDPRGTARSGASHLMGS